MKPADWQCAKVWADGSLRLGGLLCATTVTDEEREDSAEEESAVNPQTRLRTKPHRPQIRPALRLEAMTVAPSSHLSLRLARPRDVDEVSAFRTAEAASQHPLSAMVQASQPDPAAGALARSGLAEERAHGRDRGRGEQAVDNDRQMGALGKQGQMQIVGTSGDAVLISEGGSGLIFSSNDPSGRTLGRTVRSGGGYEAMVGGKARDDIDNKHSLTWTLPTAQASVKEFDR